MVMKLYIVVEHTELMVSGQFEYTNIGIYPSWASAEAARIEFTELFQDGDTQYYIEECDFYPDGE
jgi:hypothetical protein